MFFLLFLFYIYEQSSSTIPFSENVDNTFDVSSIYKMTTDGRMYTSLVTTTLPVNGTYYAIGIVPSNAISLNSLILWPGSDFNKTGNVVVRITQYNVTDENPNCCIGSDIDFPECKSEACCGEGCCCSNEFITI